MKVLILVLFAFVCFDLAQSIGEGEKCYSLLGRKLKCDDGLTCSSETRKCEYTKFCDKIKCEVTDPECNDGMTLIKADSSKCRCCDTCAFEENLAGCGSGKICNPLAERCEYKNICERTECAQYEPTCEDGEHVLPVDPSKCRCCALTCGTDDDQTGCEEGTTCNPTTGVCETRCGNYDTIRGTTNVF